MSIRRAADERIEGTPDGLNAITEIMDVPDTPSIGTATDGGTGTSVSVTFTNAMTGGTPASYTVTSTPDSITGTGSSSPITVSGLSTGTAYTFKVKAANAAGTFGPESVASNSVTPLFPAVGFYDALASTTLSATTASVTFAGIPSGYKHLQIRGIARSAAASAGGNAGIYVQFNSDTGSNYSFHYLYGTGTAAAAYGIASQTSMFTAPMNPTAGDATYLVAPHVTDILDYSSTSKYKTIRTLAGSDNNNATAQRMSLNSGLWMNTSAINSITLFMEGSFASTTQLALYGVK